MRFHIGIMALITAFSSSAEADGLKDVTKKWTYNYKVISAFPHIVEKLPVGEDLAELTQVLELSYKNSAGRLEKRRIEIFSTAGDCGYSTFAVTDIEQYQFNYRTPPRAYYLEKFSAWDLSECEEREYQGRYVRSTVRELDTSSTLLINFLEDKFISKENKVDEAFTHLCQSDKNQCIAPQSLGDLGA